MGLAKPSGHGRLRARLRAAALSLAVAAAGAVAALGPGCATYQYDLERAQRHYEANEFEKALALFRVLEDDLSSLSAPEQAKYAYLRGMTDYRLSSLAPQGTGVADPRKGYRDNARHWLGVAAAIEKQMPGGITADQKQRLNDALADLNREVYGGAEAIQDADAGAPADPAAPPAGPSAPGQ